MPKGLTEKREAFVAAYLANGRDAASAYRAAYDVKWGDEAVARHAVRLLAEPLVSARLAAAGVAPEGDDTAARVIAELKSIGFANLADYVSWSNGEVVFKNSAELTQLQTAALVEITKSRDGMRLKFDKLAALTLLGRYLGLFAGREPREAGAEPAPTGELSNAERARRIAYLLSRAEGRAEAPAKKNRGSRKNPLDDLTHNT